MAEALMFNVRFKKAWSFVFSQSLTDNQKLLFVCVCRSTCTHVWDERTHLHCMLACAESVMCLLIERRRGGGGNREPPGMPSTGLVKYCHSVISRPLTIPISHTPPPAKQRQQQPQQLHPKGPPFHQYLTSATASLCLSHFTLLCYISLSLSLSFAPPSSSSSPTPLHQSISGYFVSQLYRELLLMTTITVVYFLSAAQPLYARRASITLWYSSALY